MSKKDETYEIQKNTYTLLYERSRKMKIPFSMLILHNSENESVGSVV